MPTPLYPQTDAARASDISLSHLAQWFAVRPHLPILDEERDTDRYIPGQPRLFSPHTILQLAVARELVRRGASRRASLLIGAALVGTNRGFGPIPRPCGELWPEGETLLVFAGPDAFTFVRAEDLGAGVSWPAVMVEIDPVGEPASVIVVSVSAVLDRVAKALGVSPAALLAETEEAVAEIAEPVSEPASIPDFIALHCLRDPRRRIIPGDLYAVYRQWGTASGRPVVGRHAFGRIVRDLGIGKMKSGREYYACLAWADTPDIAELLGAAGVERAAVVVGVASVGASKTDRPAEIAGPSGDQ